jgi:hypothetical protein
LKELLGQSKPKKGSASTSMERLTLSVEDKDLLNGTPNSDISVLIKAVISNHEVHRVPVDQGSSCNIMFVGLLHKL